MVAMIVTIALGVLLCVIGGINMTGNISSVHSYHRKRVREEDKKKFGLLVGIGTIVIGLGIAAFGILYYIYERTDVRACVNAGTAAIIGSCVVGLFFSFFAMIKYNKGIF
ncbi:MAG: hypothetical protein J6U68_04140 [Clostridia bacterium]|nr:hypothetical protein [Clostridia bacterium]